MVWSDDWDEEHNGCVSCVMIKQDGFSIIELSRFVSDCAEIPSETNVLQNKQVGSPHLHMTTTACVYELIFSTVDD